MYSKLQLATKYIQYWLGASNGKGHGIHSPFVFDFVTRVMNDRRIFYCYESIESLRKQLQQNTTVLTIEDFGAGSRVSPTQQRTIASIAASALKPKKYSQLLFRMVNHYQPFNILELGTSLGITTAYLSCGKSDAHVITMEGSEAIAGVAQQNFQRLQLQNVELITGNFDDQLPGNLQRLSSVDFAFVDGNHRKAPTLAYFEQLLAKTHEHSVLIFDDVHWSREMEEAWEEIKAHPAVTLSIDLFFFGIIFFRAENKAKQHFTIRF